MSKNNNVSKLPVSFRNSSQHPLRFDKLHPGSLFRIVSEPSRKLFRVKDDSVYRKDRHGFFSTRLSDGAGCVLMPEDKVMPVVRENPQASSKQPMKEAANG